MIDSRNHVSINGVNYRLAEDAEGDHYDAGYEVLRPQNFVLAQGATRSGGEFQLRPDIIKWNIDSWHEGEGQFKFDPQSPGRMLTMHNVDGFSEPGVLLPGFGISLGYLQPGPEPGAGLITASGELAYGPSSLGGRSDVWQHEYGTGIIRHSRSDNEWETPVTHGATAADFGYHFGTFCADGNFLYWMLITADDIYKYDGTTFTLLNSDITVGVGNQAMMPLGDFLYVFDDALGEVREISIGGAGPNASTIIYTFGPLGGVQAEFPQNKIIRSDNRLYLYENDGGDTVIHEITPTSAAGTGFGNEVLRIPGYECQGIVWHLGFLYLFGLSGRGDAPADGVKQAILYWRPGQEFGTLGSIKEDGKGFPRLTQIGDNSQGMFAQSQATSLLSIYFSMNPPYNDDTDEAGIYEINVITGGIQQIWGEDAGSTAGQVLGMVHGNGILHVMQDRASGDNIIGIHPFEHDSHDFLSYAITPSNDFALAEDKILNTIQLVTEPLPADWTVFVDYSVDDSGTWTTAVTYTTDGGTGEKVEVSLPGATVKFRELKLRIRFLNANEGTEVSKQLAPRVRVVEVFASVNRKVKTWRLLLDLSDEEEGGQGRSFNGARLMDELNTVNNSEDVVVFQDGYQSREPNDFDVHNVVVDSARLLNDRPGEGVALVVLRENF